MSSRRATAKVELPLTETGEIAEKVRQFERCSLPYQHWTHRAHLAVAVTYLREMPYDAALETLRTNINRYNNTCGDPRGYNETITILFLKRLDADMTAGRNLASLPEEIARLADAYSVDWLYRYYSKTLIWSNEAKTAWITPDLRPLDF